MLVALIRDKKDFAILKNEGWYRIPVIHTPKRWPPDYIAFYQPLAFGNDAFRIRFYGKVAQINQATRRELFPNEFESELSNKVYHRIQIERLEERHTPILARFARPVVFVPTTWQKFMAAEELNDLFDESPLEDLLWEELKRHKVPAERQWRIQLKGNQYFFDFAFLCNQGKLDVETDGDTWHLNPGRVAQDNQRDNAAAELGWHVLRFNTRQIQEQRANYCLPNILETINTLGGLTEDGLVPRKFIYQTGEIDQQLNLFEEQGLYSDGSEEEILE